MVAMDPCSLSKENLMVPYPLPTLCFYLPCLLLFMLAIVYVERKMAAFIQGRLGPREVGYKGILQSIADLLKLLQKEVILPQQAHPLLFILAPAWIFVAVMLGFTVLPVHSSWLGAPSCTGVLFLLGILSLKVMGVLLAGYASNNKFARLGSLRALTQYLSYEIPLGLSVLCVIVVTHTFSLGEIASQQGLPIYQIDGVTGIHSYLLGIKGCDVTSYGGLLTWNICRMPPLVIAYGIFLLSTLAMSQVAPFDLAEAESELVAGYHVEYGGIYFAWMMLGEYALLFLMNVLGVSLFLGGWNTPLPNVGCLQAAVYTNGYPSTWSGIIWSLLWLFGKALVITLCQLWLKWTMPRLRIDQLVKLCWLFLVPLGLVTLLLTIWWQWLLL